MKKLTNTQKIVVLLGVGSFLIGVHIPSAYADGACSISTLNNDTDILQQCNDFFDNCVQTAGAANNTENNFCYNQSAQWQTAVNKTCYQNGNYTQSCVASTTAAAQNGALQQASQQNNQFNNCINNGGTGVNCGVQTGLISPPVQQVSAPTPAQTKGYTPLEPLPGFEDSKNLDFPAFLKAVFKLLITAGALLAVGTLVYAGIMYIMSGAGVELNEAKTRMRAALWGMAILLGAWLMLNTVNPTLLNFNPNSIGGGSNTNTGGAGTTQTIGSTPSAAQQQPNLSTCTSQGGY